jgi:hypothetical protein
MRSGNTGAEVHVQRIVGCKNDTHLQNIGTYMNKYKEKLGGNCRKARE